MLSQMKVALVGIAPERMLQLTRARRRQSLFLQAGVAFIHVPRTAGTSITEQLFGRFIGHFALQDLLATGSAPVRALPRFTVVRNPWDRAVSAWSYARNIMSQSNKVVRPAQYRAPAFDTFERFVHEWLATRDVERLDGIFRPQAHYVLDSSGRMDFDHVGRLDRMDQTEAWLNSVLDRPFAMVHRNASPRSPYRDYYTPALRDEIARIYAADVALLGYDF